MASSKPFAPKFKRSTSGVTKIIRDDYGKKGDWYKLEAEVKKRDGGCCVFCNAKEDPGNKVYHEVHHITPLSRGGTNSKSNLCTVCTTCHDRRHSHLPAHRKEKAAGTSAGKGPSAKPKGSSDPRWTRNPAKELSSSLSTSPSVNKFSAWRRA
jgi:hypothetical protein